MIVETIFASTPLVQIREKVDERVAFGRTRSAESLALPAYDLAVSKLVGSDSIPPNVDERLHEFSAAFKVPLDALRARPSHRQLVKRLALSDFETTGATTRFKIDGAQPFQLLKGDQIAYAENNIAYFEVNSRREYVGGSRGVSVRVAKGVSYRVGSFRGHSVSRDEVTRVGVGPFAIGHRAIYFYSPAKSVRITYDKMAAIVERDDGIEIQRDAETAKPQYFVGPDSWFLHGVIQHFAGKAL